MNNQPPPPLVQYLCFIDYGDPERVSPSDLLEMAGAVKHYLASTEGTTRRAEPVSTLVCIRNAPRRRRAARRGPPARPRSPSANSSRGCPSSRPSRSTSSDTTS